MHKDANIVAVDPAVAEWNAGVPATTTSYEPPADFRDIRQLMNTAGYSGLSMMAFSGLMGFSAAIMSAGSSYGPGMTWSLVIGAFVTCSMFAGSIIGLNRERRDHDESLRIGIARSTLMSLAGKEHASHPEVGYLLHALSQDEKPGSANAALLVAVDPVLRRYAVLMSRIGHDQDATSKARLRAMDSVSRIIADRRARSEQPTEQSLLSSFEDDCVAISDGRDPTSPTRVLVPSARIARIIDTAEKALRTHPSLTDDAGGRIDDLVRVHVPRLLDTHARAAGTAAADEMQAVDAALDEAVELVRTSVEEALSRLHDEATSALTTEIRFLTLRRGTTPLLTAVA